MRRLAHLLGLVAIVAFAAFPLTWMVSSSLKTQADLLASPPVWLFHPTWAHYLDILADQKVIDAVFNSLVVALCTTALAVGLGTPAAYALARFEFRAKAELWFWLVSSRMISPLVLALPISLLARQTGLLDTHLVLILVYLTFNLPVVVWVCTDQFRAIPGELAQAARLDSATDWQIFRLIYLPLALPGVAVSAIFSFIFSWNELLYALVLTRRDVQTAPVVATGFLSGYEVPWGKIMATGTVIVLPAIVLGLLVSRHMIRALTMGAAR